MKHVHIFGGRNLKQGIGVGAKGKGEAASLMLWRMSVWLALQFERGETRKTSRRGWEPGCSHPAPCCSEGTSCGAPSAVR